MPNPLKATTYITYDAPKKNPISISSPSARPIEPGKDLRYAAKDARDMPPPSIKC
ncbi:MAG: hypothetical protein R2824_27180 [Saprospiraceae bacterium]